MAAIPRAPKPKPKPAPAPKPTRQPLTKKRLAAIILYVDLSTEYSTEAYVKRTLAADRMNPDDLYRKLASIGYIWKRNQWQQKSI